MLLVPDQKSPAWFAAHYGRLSGSTAAAALGFGSQSARWAWRMVLGIEPDRDNLFKRWGVENEQHARAAYEALTGQLVLETGFWVHDEFPWLGASPDGLIGDDGLLEVKCPVTALPTRLPVEHRIQCLIQLAVTGRKWCDYFAWSHEGHFLVRVFPQGLSGLVHKLEQWRRLYVLTETEPPRKRPRRRKRGPAQDRGSPGLAPEPKAPSVAAALESPV